MLRQGLNLPAINAEVDRRGFVPVSEKMEVLDKSGKPVTNVFCIGDANGKPTQEIRHCHKQCIKGFQGLFWSANNTAGQRIVGQCCHTCLNTRRERQYMQRACTGAETMEAA